MHPGFNLTDIVVLLFLVYFFFSGWFRGLAKTLIGPSSLIIGSLIAAGYYYFSKNFLASLFLSIVLPIILWFIFSFIFKIWKKNNSDDKKSIFILERMWAAIINLLWSGAWLIITLIFLTTLPTKPGWLEKIQFQITYSKTYSLITKLSSNKLDLKKGIDRMKDPAVIKKIEKSPEFQSLVQDQKIQTLLNDPEIVPLIQNKDYLKLMNNPKMQAILKDKDLLEKFFAVYRKTSDQ